MDEIIVNGMQFYGYHGVLPEETAIGQRFIVNVRMRLNLQQAGQSDSVADTVDYAKVYEVVKKIVENQPKKLIEAVAEAIAVTLLKTFSKLASIVVEVEKPGAPIPGIFGQVCVRLERTRNQI